MDYEPIDTRIAVTPFSSEATVELELLSDTLDEPDETIEFELSEIDGAQPDTVRGTFTIRDDDDPRKPGELAYMGASRATTGRAVRAGSGSPSSPLPWARRR